jgi:hypothetical protein
VPEYDFEKMLNAALAAENKNNSAQPDTCSAAPTVSPAKKD